MDPIKATFTGRLVNVFDLRPQDVDLQDITHSLSMTGRWGGHARSFFTVAAHSLLCLYIARHYTNDPKILLRVLMHDAFEAYLGDIATPIKLNLTPRAEVAPGLSLEAVEQRGLLAIFEALGIEKNAHGAALGRIEKIADAVALETERRLLTAWEREPDPRYTPNGEQIAFARGLIATCDTGHPSQIEKEFRFWFDELKTMIARAP